MGEKDRQGQGRGLLRREEEGEFGTPGAGVLLAGCEDEGRGCEPKNVSSLQKRGKARK